MHCWHAIWLDPHNKKRFWIGSDGGLALTHDDGETYLRFENLNVTQYYDVAADMRDPVLAVRRPAGRRQLVRSVGDARDGDLHERLGQHEWRRRLPRRDGSDRPSNRLHRVATRHQRRQRRAHRPGDAAVSQSIRPRKGVNIVNYDDYITPEIEKRQKDLNWGEAPPPPPRGAARRRRWRAAVAAAAAAAADAARTMGAFRWNWSTPFILSEHNPRTLYLGANHLFKTHGSRRHLAHRQPRPDEERSPRRRCASRAA